jgi:hypothetical protein
MALPGQTGVQGGTTQLPVSITPTDTDSGNLVDVTGTTYTASNVQIGDPHPQRRVAMAFTFRSNTDPSGVTINGKAATRLAGHRNTASTPDTNTAIYWAPMPESITQCDVVVTFGASEDREVAYTAFRVIGGTGTPGTAFEAGGTSADSQNVTIPTDGGAIFVYMSPTAGARAWTNATEASDFAHVGGPAAGNHTTAYRTTAGAVTAQVDQDGAGSDGCAIPFS